MKRHVRRRIKRKRTLFWLFIIALCCIVLSALTVTSTAVVEKFYKFFDSTYLPIDTDRMNNLLEKVKSTGKK